MKKNRVYIDAEILYLLEMFFTRKQCKVIMKKYNSMLLTKTDAEYYSMTCKKKLKSLSDLNTQAMITQLIERME